ncbi:DUF4373 domain-containing protein [Gudongella sp. DL1XJH-153]|uniref:DUF4373 domain-containing protein n=1 Tax=Gudongella sp. DL1XJH-153 TaxID=3409804 RepID=UPI003BB67253
MARPNKQGVDYFPMDVYMDDKFKFIEVKYKLEGFAILIKLFQKIYSSGFWCRWTNDELILFSDENRTNFELVQEVINEALERGIFSKKLYDKYNILTSRGIQRRYKEIVRRRKDVEIVTEYLLIDNIKGVNDGNMSEEGQHDDDIIPEEGQHDDDKNEQRKQKGKETETKQKQKGNSIPEKLSSFRSKYSGNDLRIVDSFLEIIANTRKGGKVSDGVILKIYQDLDQYPVEQVIQGLRRFNEKPEYHDKGEKYAIGIVRNTKPEEEEVEKPEFYDDNYFLNRRSKHYGS